MLLLRSSVNAEKCKHRSTISSHERVPLPCAPHQEPSHRFKKAASEVTSALQRLHLDRALTIVNAVHENLQVACDAQDLNEMLANLVDNACKHAVRKVRLSAARSNDQAVVIVVEDDGAGLPAEAHEVVFQIGERWDTQVPGAWALAWRSFAIWRGCTAAMQSLRRRTVAYP